MENKLDKKSLKILEKEYETLLKDELGVILSNTKKILLKTLSTGSILLVTYLVIQKLIGSKSKKIKEKGSHNKKSGNNRLATIISNKYAQKAILYIIGEVLKNLIRHYESKSPKSTDSTFNK